MKRYVVFTLCLILLALIAAGAVVGLGLFNVSARQGHLPGVYWILHTTYRNSVDLRAPSADTVPDLSDEGLVQLGAGHYDSACVMCHGVPGQASSATVQHMVPMPPPIQGAVENWNPAELFWTVKNGVKMSGMPAWPTLERSDEVWPVVAFLNRVTEMDAAAYDAMLTQDATQQPGLASLQTYRQRCQVCHGPVGLGVEASYVPRLDLLNEAYIKASLLAYRSGERHSGIMQQVASLLSDEEIDTLAEVVGKISGRTAPAVPPTEGVDRSADLIAAGAKIAAGESEHRDVPACNACHGPYPVERSELFPALAGQHEGYILRQLELFKSDSRGGSERARLMHEVVPHLDKAQMQSLAAYYASLAPALDLP